MRLVFLDIDGVLVPLSDLHENRRVCCDLLPDLGGCPEFSLACVTALNWLCETAGANIVISSTWRQHIPLLPAMRAIMRQQGVWADVIGMTPIAEGDWESHDRRDEVAHF
ncbi:HAD domain-containing protein [Mariniblastus sp.]|nr:HAD domain-containing protein [Mariniblastus sp.]